MTTLAALEKGYEFPPASFDLSEEWVDAYITAVEDKAIRALRGSFVPPMAVAALAIRGMLQEVSLPWVTLHARQVLEFVAPVRWGETLAVSASVKSRKLVRGSTLMKIEVCVARGRETVMTGRALITFPVVPEPEEQPASHPAGTAFQALTKTITQEKIDDYALASGDDNPLHVDLDRAATTPFRGTIAHGMLVLAYISEMLTAAFDEDWLAGSKLDVKFQAPARPGDTLSAFGTMKSDGHGETVYEIECRNQRDEVVLNGKAEVSR